MAIFFVEYKDTKKLFIIYYISLTFSVLALDIGIILISLKIFGQVMIFIDDSHIEDGKVLKDGKCGLMYVPETRFSKVEDKDYGYSRVSSNINKHHFSHGFLKYEEELKEIVGNIFIELEDTNHTVLIDIDKLSIVVDILNQLWRIR